ncbi:MAG: HAD family hydrolase [Clostridia bacterium]|nr:HAD family hydrolase [Clostridia bacterium]
MRYRCLVIDHDDTVVNSTETIHYPCFISFMDMQGRDMREEVPIEKYLEYNCLGNIMEFYLDKVGLSQELLDEETLYWRDCVNNYVPKAYEGIREILTRFRELGGKIYVASHSESRFILRDCKENGLPAPDGIFGYDAPSDLCKPSPKIIDTIIAKTGIPREEILVIDDLRHGFELAKNSGVTFAAAGWGYSVPRVEALMRSVADYYLKSVSDLDNLLFSQS